MRCRPLDVQERTVREGVKLLNLNLSASLFQLLLDVVSLSLGDLLLDSLGSAINDSLSLLQAQTGDLLNDLDDLHLGSASLSQDDVELGLLFLSGSSSATSACRGNRGVDVNLDDFMLSSVANDKKARIPLSYSGSGRNASDVYKNFPAQANSLLGTAG